MVTRRDSWELQSGEPVAAELTAVRLLGGGAAYEAYLASDEVTLGPVVVKLVRPGQVRDERTLRGLRREVGILERVNHPAVVRQLRAEVDGDRPHVVLEHLDGPRLSTLVRRYGPLEPAQYLPLGIEVASALHYLRRLEIVHLDIKPSNVIMGAPARLIDLSVARSVLRAAVLTYPLGTDAYMSPEQCDPPRTGTPGPSSDIWGLGVTLFEAVAGYQAYEEADADATDVASRFPQLVNDPRRLPERVPQEVAKVLEACLASRPEDRPSPREVADGLAGPLERLPRGRLAGFSTSAASRSTR